MGGWVDGREKEGREREGAKERSSIFWPDWLLRGLTMLGDWTFAFPDAASIQINLLMLDMLTPKINRKIFNPQREGERKVSPIFTMLILQVKGKCSFYFRMGILAFHKGTLFFKWSSSRTSQGVS